MKTAAACLMVTLFSLLLAVSLSRELHHFLHHNAHQPDHHCVATQLAGGQLLETPCVLTLPPPAWQLAPPPVVVTKVRLPAGDLRLMPGRAPPLVAA